MRASSFGSYVRALAGTSSALGFLAFEYGDGNARHEFFSVPRSGVLVFYPPTANSYRAHLVIEDDFSTRAQRRGLSCLFLLEKSLKWKKYHVHL